MATVVYFTCNVRQNHELLKKNDETGTTQINYDPLFIEQMGHFVEQARTFLVIIKKDFLDLMLIKKNYGKYRADTQLFKHPGISSCYFKGIAGMVLYV
jgi:hypothetical protein